MPNDSIHRCAELPVKIGFGKPPCRSSQVKRIERWLQPIEGPEGVCEPSLGRIPIEYSALFADDFESATAAQCDDRLAARQRFHHGYSEVFFAGHDECRRARIQCPQFRVGYSPAKLDILRRKS